MSSNDSTLEALRSLGIHITSVTKELDIAGLVYLYKAVPEKKEDSDGWSLVNLLQARFLADPTITFMGQASDLRPMVAQGTGELLRHYSALRDAPEEADRQKAKKMSHYMKTIAPAAASYLSDAAGFEAALLGGLCVIIPSINHAVYNDEELTELDLLHRVDSFLAVFRNWERRNEE